MPKRQENSAAAIQFSEGRHVRVKKGVVHPDFDYIPLGGWLGTVVDVEDDVRYVQWSKETLEAAPAVYFQRCERFDFDWTAMWLGDEDLEADPGEPLYIEQPKKIGHTPTSVEAQEERIRAVFGLGGADAIPDVDEHALRVFYKHLTAQSLFPFDAMHTAAPSPLGIIRSCIKVLEIIDPGKYPDEEYGLFCKARRGRRKIELPLANVEADKTDPRIQIVDDYAYWFENWR